MVDINEKNVIEFLQKQQSEAKERLEKVENEYNSIKADYDRLTNAIAAYNGFNVSVSKKANQQKVKDSHPSVAVYRADWTIAKKVIFAIQTYNHVLGTQDICEFINKQEPELDPEKLIAGISAELHKLKKQGTIIGGKPTNEKIKGFLYGKPDWFNEKGVIREDYLKILQKEKEAKNLWE